MYADVITDALKATTLPLLQSLANSFGHTNLEVVCVPVLKESLCSHRWFFTISPSLTHKHHGCYFLGRDFARMPREQEKN